MLATLPAPTRYAGVPLAYAARTLACDPVATTRSLRRISSVVEHFVTGGVAALERIDDFVSWSCPGVGRGRHRAHHADWPGDLDDAPGFVDGNHADRPRALQVVQEAECLAIVLANLVLDVADTGRLNGKLSEGAVARWLDNRPIGCGDDDIDPCLCRSLVDSLRGAGAFDPHLDISGDGVILDEGRRNPMPLCMWCQCQDTGRHHARLQHRWDFFGGEALACQPRAVDR